MISYTSNICTRIYLRKESVARGGPTYETLRPLTIPTFQYLYICTRIYRRERISRGELTCETLRPSSLLVLQLGLARQVEGDLDVLGVVNSEDVETLTPGNESV